ncbi:MAG: ABC transporter permease [Proteobacteria bacterium]|nr:ABC transporter permease [Pseudomonadota bacterium]MCH8999225.1 ABC transporter permease [Pseudomonadota bacterium]
MVATSSEFVIERPQGWLGRVLEFARRNPTVVIGTSILALMAAVAVFAPWLATDPLYLNPIDRLKPPSKEFWFGTDHLGRDVYARTVFGTRISLTVGLAVATFSTAIGLAIGLVAGYIRIVDAIVMRIMDGLMAIPGILFAIALMALFGSSVQNVIIAITVPEVPRVVRLVRAVVLTIREQPFIEAAVASGTRLPRILVRHILPNIFAPLMVQATYVCASAVIVEALLSFLGAGTPPEVPSWGNMMADGRVYFQIKPWIILFPGICLALMVLTVNVLGDGLRDTLDPRIARRMR